MHPSNNGDSKDKLAEDESLKRVLNPSMTDNP